MNKRFTLREPTVDDTIGCSEISDNGEWVSYGDIVDFLNELYYENKELKKENQRLVKMLDNVANCMQRQNKDVPLDDFVEWFNKMSMEGVDD